MSYMSCIFVSLACKLFKDLFNFELRFFKVQDYVYRVVEVRGVFDHDQEMHVGPRPGMDDSGETTAGVLVVTPLRLEDGDAFSERGSYLQVLTEIS